MPADSNDDVHPSRHSGLRATIERGGVALGVLDDTDSPELVELYGDLGFEFVWHDLEHTGPAAQDARSLAALLRAADAAGTDLLVRVPTPDPATIRKVLDTGVRNVLVPRVETPEEVERAVDAARFSSDGTPGDRGFAFPRASRWGRLDATEYVVTEDREVLIGVMIETPAAVERIEEILAVPELGFVFVGPFDLAAAMGYPGEVSHPDVEERVSTVASATRETDVALGGLAFDDGDAASKIDTGYQVLHVGSTTAAVIEDLEVWPGQFDDR